MYSPRKISILSTYSITPSATHVIFSYEFKQTIFKNSFSSSPSSAITYLKLNDDFNYSISKLPPCLETLYLGLTFNHPLPAIPKTLTSISFSTYYNFPITSLLPPSLTFLSLGLKFDKEIPFHEFPSLLSFQYSRRKTISHFPSTLTYLNLQQNEITTLPPSILHLFCYTKKPINLSNLPPNLITFSPGHLFNQPVDNLLPSSLKYLEIKCKDFDHSLDSLPPSLTRLSIKYEYNIFNRPIDSLPPSLTILKIKSNTFSHPVDHLPSSLTILKLPNNYNFPLNKLPPSLTTLILGNEFNQAIDNLPKNLLHLKLHENFNQSLENLPPSLISLKLQSSKFSYPLNVLPETITKLEIGFFKIDSGSFVLPSSLLYLNMAGIPGQFIPSPLPKTLRKLIISNKFHDKQIKEVPKYVKIIKI